MDSTIGANWTENSLESTATTTSTTTPSPYRYYGGRIFYTTSTLSPEEARSLFFAGYDWTTGLRIAVTLGAIIGLFTLFLIYKSKCRPSKPVHDSQEVV